MRDCLLRSPVRPPSIVSILRLPQTHTREKRENTRDRHTGGIPMTMVEKKSMDMTRAADAQAATPNVHTTSDDDDARGGGLGARDRFLAAEHCAHQGLAAYTYVPIRTTEPNEMCVVFAAAAAASSGRNPVTLRESLRVRALAARPTVHRTTTTITIATACPLELRATERDMQHYKLVYDLSVYERPAV